MKVITGSLDDDGLLGADLREHPSLYYPANIETGAYPVLTNQNDCDAVPVFSSPEILHSTMRAVGMPADSYACKEIRDEQIVALFEEVLSDKRDIILDLTKHEDGSWSSKKLAVMQKIQHDAKTCN